MKDLNDLSNAQGLDESITENYTNYYGDDDYSNIDWKDPFKGLKKNIKDAGKNIRDTTKDIGKNIKTTTKEIGQNIKTTTKEIGQNIERTTKEVLQNKNLKKVMKGFLTYNPVIAVPRSAALLAFRVNLFGISSRLYPAFLDEAALKKGNFNLENSEKAKKAWEDVANFWEDKLGGDRNKLREAISGAWNKAIFKTKKSKERERSTSFNGNTFGDVSTFYEDDNYSNFEPLSDTAIAAYITSGLGIVSTVVGMLAKKGASKNPYDESTPEGQQFNNQSEDAGSPPPVNREEMEKMIAAAVSDKQKGLGLDDTGIDLLQANELKKEEELLERKSGRILGIPKTPFWIGVGVLGIIAGIVIYKKFIKK